jgi:NADP-dependent alcohol dehydrogenase
MFNFTYHNPVKIIFGKDQIAALTNLIPADYRVLLAYGGGSIKKNGVYDQVMQALQHHHVTEFSGIEPNPKYETLMRASNLCREQRIDFILAVGGGSVIDGVKFIAAANCFSGDPWAIVANEAEVKQATPFGCVLTLPATGSEMNCGSVISKAHSPDKLAFMSPKLYPQFSILDPTTTYSLPTKQTSNGIVDIFVHVTEQYLTYPVGAALQDRFAEAILLALIEEAPKVFANPNNYDARANIMWCGTMALNELIGVGVPQDWATHRLGHEITARFNLDHGETLAIILPSLLQVRREQKRSKLIQYAERIWNITAGSSEQKIDGAIAKTRSFFEQVGVKTHLSDYNITADAIPELVKQLEKHQLTALGEHQDINLKTSEEIFRGSL